MFGFELSISLVVISVIQASGLGIHLLFSTRMTKETLLSSKTLVGFGLLFFNVVRLVNNHSSGFWDAFFFSVTCGLLAAIFIESEVKSRSRLVLAILANIGLFFILLAFTYRMENISHQDRMLLLAGALIFYSVVVSMLKLLSWKKGSVVKNHLPKFLLGTIFSIGALVTLFSDDEQLHGLLTTNFIFVSLVIFQILKPKVFDFWKSTNIQGEGNTVLLHSENDTSLDSLDQRLKPYKLTKRQAEIARLLLKRMSRTQIADQLNISESTVSTHCSALFEKTDTFSRSDFILKFTEKQR